MTVIYSKKPKDPSKVEFGDCREIMRTWPDNFIQTCVTSPPYFGLRDYGTGTWEGGEPGCTHSASSQVQDTKAPGAIVTGVRPGVDNSTCRTCGATRVDKQLGLEQTPEDYIANMVEVFREVKRVLRDDGTLWLNIGDSYASSGGVSQPHRDGCGGIGKKGTRGQQDYASSGGGFHKPNTASGLLKPKDLIGIPWMLAFALRADGWYLRQDIVWAKGNPMPESVRDRCTKAHGYIFLLSKSQKYYFDSDAIKEIAVGGNSKGNGQRLAAQAIERTGGIISGGTAKSTLGTSAPETRNRRSVWTVNTKPYKGAHFATFPTTLIEPCIFAGSRPGDVVLDPFMGSGTTAVVAKKHGRFYAGCELNPEYESLQKERLEKSY